MSNEKLTPWPTKEQYEAAWKGRERDLTMYYQNAAFAAMERLKLAVQVLDALVMTLPPGRNRVLVADTIAAIDMPKERA